MILLLHPYTGTTFLVSQFSEPNFKTAFKIVKISTTKNYLNVLSVQNLWVTNAPSPPIVISQKSEGFLLPNSAPGQLGQCTEHQGIQTPSLLLTLLPGRGLLDEHSKSSLSSSKVSRSFSTIDISAS